MSTFEEKEEHPSYGLISVGRIHGGDATLFGSPLKHRQRIRLTISRAVRSRDLSHDWYYGRDELIEVDMSPAQWAELLSSLNQGPGVPCTIVHVDGEHAPACPDRHEREKVEQEFKGTMKQAAEKYRNDIEDIKQILSKKSLTKADRASVLNAVENLRNVLTNHATFIQSSFNEAVDKTVHAAKVEVEAFWSSLVQRAGERALLEQGSMPVVSMLEDRADAREQP